MAGIDAQGHAVLLSQMGKDSLFIRGGRVFPERPDTAVRVPTDEMVGFKLDDRGRNHIQKFLDMHISHGRLRGRLAFLQMDTSLYF